VNIGLPWVLAIVIAGVAGTWVQTTRLSAAQAEAAQLAAECDTRVSEASNLALTEAAELDVAADAIARDEHATTSGAVADAANNTAARGETIRYVTRTLPAPVAGPVVLPDSVRDALTAAAAEAAAAGRELRAGIHARRAPATGRAPPVDDAGADGLGSLGERGPRDPDAGTPAARR
jgi:hypothetical protein